MALSELSRRSIHQALSPLTGGEAITEMLSNFARDPAHDPVTKEYLDLRVEASEAKLRTEMSELKVELRQEVHDLSNRLMLWIAGSTITTIGSTAAMVVPIALRG